MNNWIKALLIIGVICIITPDMLAQDSRNWRLYRSRRTEQEKPQSQPQNEPPVLPTPYQNNNDPQEGIVNIYEDYRIAQLVDRFMKTHADGKIDGYRVQLFFGGRDKARETKAAFLQKYPKIRADVTYLAPNFRVRVGNFRTLLEAEKFKSELKAKFPSCYIVQERIPLPEL